MPDELSPQATPPDTERPGVGDQLRKARAERGLAVEQVSERLHLDETVVQALEDEQFAQVGAPVFVVGHLKAYARLLEIPADSLLAAYRASLPDEPATPTMPSRSRKRGLSINPGPWGIGVIVLLLAAALGWYVMRDDGVPPEPAVPVGILPSESGRLPLPPRPAGEATGIPVDETVPANTAEAAVPPVGGTEPEPESSPVTEVEPEPAPVATVVAPRESAAPEPAAAGAEQTTLELYFRSESWVEISDRNRRILFGLQREGVRRELQGEPPFQLLLGNAAGVDLYVEGELYALPSGSTRGKVARLTIDPARTGQQR